MIDADIESGAVQEEIAELTISLESDLGLGPSTVIRNQSGDLAQLSMPLSAGPSTEKGIGTVRRLRAEYIPRAFSVVSAEALVTGTTAKEIDFIDLGRRYLPDFLSWLPQLQVDGDSAIFDAALKTGD